MVRLLHTADIHLGRQFPAFGEKGIEYRNQIIRTFEKIADHAIKQKVNVLLISGDLFDSNRVYGLVLSKVVAVLTTLGKAGVKVCLIPGTHDPYDAGSIYRAILFPDNVTILYPERKMVTFDDLDLTVYGLFPEQPDIFPIPATKSHFRVGMAHCSIKSGNNKSESEAMLDREQIAASGLDYIALGHWHSYLDVSQGAVNAAYCGAPEPIDIDQDGAGNVIIVELQDPKEIKCQPLHVGTKKCKTVSLDISPFNSSEDLVQSIQQHSDPNLILRLNLTGLSKMDCELDLEHIAEHLENRFFNLRITDLSHPPLEEIKTLNFPEKTVMGRFLNIAGEKVAQAANPEEKKLYEEALKLGYALLQGRTEVLD